MVAVALAPATPAAGVGAPGGFEDVPEDAYYAVPVRTLDDDGVFAGTLCEEGFCPSVPIDRKTMAVWTVRVLDGGDPPAVSETRFDDVDAGGFHARFIERMAELGVTKGCGDRSGFCPDRNVTRAQMAVFLSRAYDLPDGPDPGFADVPGDAWYAAEVAKLAASGITVGCRDRTVFCPGRDTTRGQMATFLHRALSQQSLWVGLESPAPGAVTGAFDVTITFSHAVTGFAEGDISVANGEAVGLSGSGRAYTAEIKPAADGAVVVRVPADAARDDRGRGNEVSAPLTRVRASRGGVVGQGIDTWDRAAVNDAYVAEFDRTEPDWDYTGDVDECAAGTTGQQFRDSVFQRLNWYRQMAGLRTVAENQDSSAGAQQAALMMLAEGRLSHEPDSDWACYSSTGRSYAGANLGLGTSVGGLAGIDGYMRDPGEDNIEVGHRRWILYPQTQQMGTGNVRRGSRQANALWPRDPNTFSSRPAVREQRGFVAWPPSGYVPPEAVWGRWSFSLAGADFSRASVTMSDDAGPVQAEVIHRSAAPRPNSRSAPETAIVWAVAGDTDSNLLPSPSGPDHCYTVNVSGVRVGGATQHPYEYSTCLMGEPSVPLPPDHATRTGGVDDIPGPEQDATEDDTPATPTSTIHSFKAVTAGDSHSCGLRSDDTITCWGNNEHGRSNAPGGSFKAVSAGNLHSCGLRSDDTITCWGYNGHGHTNAPGGSFKAVTASGTHSCGLRSDDTITCWGYNGHGQTNAPGGSFKAVTAGGTHSCGLRSDDTITCWGNNGHGQTNAPGGSFKAVTASGTHSCGLRSDDTITCWGNNEHGQTNAPGGSFKAVSARILHSCGLRSDDTITCWGYNGHGQTNAPGGSFKAVTAGGTHSCGLRSDDTITCWGNNKLGQSATPSGTLLAPFIDVAAAGYGIFGYEPFVCGLRSDGIVTCWGGNRTKDEPSGRFQTVSAGHGHACALRLDSTIICWGRDAAYWNGGQWNIAVFRPAPALNFRAVDAGNRFSCGVLSDHTVVCWGGDNEHGELLAPDGSFDSVAAGHYHACGVRIDKTVTCWGDNSIGQTDTPDGHFKAVSGTAPCGLRTDNTITCWGKATAPHGHFKALAEAGTCGVRTDDTVICWADLRDQESQWSYWGGSDYGQTNAPSGSFKSVSGGGYGLHTCGVRTDDTIVCWGIHLRGRLYHYGQMDAPDGTFKAVSTGIAAPYRYACGLRTDNTITCWGDNHRGQTDAPSTFKTIGGRGDAVCGIREDNTIRCWGHGLYYAIRNTPSGDFKDVTSGNDFGCGVRTDDTIICWGDRVAAGQFGQTVYLNRRKVLVLDGSFKAVTGGISHVCGLRSNDTITCWRRNSGDPDDQDFGEADAPSGQFETVSAGEKHTCGLRTDNTISCWGKNNHGQTDAPDGHFKAVSAGDDYTCGLRTDNTISCWGKNNHGQTDAPDGHFKIVKAGKSGHPCGLRNDGTIICWGVLPLHVPAGEGSES